jgi:ribosomal protein L15
MKRFVSRIVMALMVVALLTGSAFAGGTGKEMPEPGFVTDYSVAVDQPLYHPGSTEAKIIRIAEKANADVDKEIAKAQRDASKVKKDADFDRIIEKLFDKTEKILSKAIDEIEKLGGEAECEYVEVLIGDRVVLVDPLRIVRL